MQQQQNPSLHVSSWSDVSFDDSLMHMGMTKVKEKFKMLWKKFVYLKYRIQSEEKTTDGRQFQGCTNDLLSDFIFMFLFLFLCFWMTFLKGIQVKTKLNLNVMHYIFHTVNK